MPTTEHEIDRFAAFAKAEIGKPNGNRSIEEILDAWRLRNPPSDDLLAVRAALRDMENGERGRSFEEFATDFESRNSIASDR
jgi:hypothetical protein